jgi:hypothetical protein
VRLIASATYAKLRGPAVSKHARMAQARLPTRLCAAIVDRLAFAGNSIETGTVSYRLVHARAQRSAAR